jgi:energy-coupling factor transporter ATP-binding protein EcfA2
VNLQEDMLLTNVTVQAPNNSKEILLLKEISLRITAGEWISIVGKNGSGKSTLAQLLTGVLPIHSGFIERGFCGQEPMPYVMQQDVQWFGETPWEDIVFLLESRGEKSNLIPEIALSALQSVGLEFLRHCPFTELSGGQKQLSAIAGCLAAKTPLLLFDEAASMLDSTSRKQVMETAKYLHLRGSTVIWLTHQLDDLSFGERVIALEQGKICYDGSTTSFFYGKTEENRSSHTKTPCEVLGFVLPFPIQVARELEFQGVPLQSLPLTGEQLLEAVNGLG